MSEKIEIGNITTGYRLVKKGNEYDRYFPKPEERDRVIIEDGEVVETVDLMKKVVWKYLSDTKKIAPTLKGSTIAITCNNIWNFLYHHIQYRLDKKGVEQLRRPTRSWYERKEGIDCDCFSIFASSILTNLGIPHSFRITKYDRDVFQHVYVIVPTGKGYHIIDPVLSKSNYEKPFTEKKDFPMSIDGINIAVLSGTMENDLYDAVMATDLDGLGLGSMNEKEEIEALYRHLIATRNAISQDPESIALVDDPTAFLKMLDYAIEHWNTPNRGKALDILAENEDRLNLQNGISGLEDIWDEEDELLGRLFRRRKKRNRKGFFTGMKKAVKGIGKGLKKVGKAIIRFNPVSIAARNGFLVALKLNIKKMGSKLKWAYATKEQAAKKGVSTKKWNQSKHALDKVEKLFADKLQGSRTALRKAIVNGRAGNLNGVIEGSGNLSGLGEPVTAAGAAALIATATPVIISVIKILKKSGLMDESESEEVIITENDISSIQTKNGSQHKDSQSLIQDGSSEFDMEADPDDPDTTQKNKIFRFLKMNPMVAVGGLAAIGGIGYMLFAGEDSKPKPLSGTETKKVSKKKSPIRKPKTNKVKTIRLS